MTLHVLIVEDDEDFIEELEEIVGRLPVQTRARFARSRDEAFRMLESDFLDLVVLDLKIPTVDGALDAHPEHGHAVFGRILTAAPGTPVFVLTGSPAEDFFSELLKRKQEIDIWGEGRSTGTVLFRKKSDVDTSLEVLAPIARAIRGLADIELEAAGLELTEAEDRLLRIFTRKFGGVRCAAADVQTGLSGSRVIRMRVTGEQGTLVHDAVAKISSHADVRKEADCYDLHVKRLAAEATPRRLATLEYGAHSLAGIFFGLAKGAESVFDVLREEASRGEECVVGVRGAMANWVKGVPQTRTAIGDVRRRLLRDKDLERVRNAFGLDWVEEFESRQVQACVGCIHGDLHGGNIFVSAANAQLIDYGDVGDGAASLDPVTLELSLLFHPEGPGREVGWPSEVQALTWGSVERYVQGCPFAGFVRESRTWAGCVAAGRREVAASAYSYLVRQLKYEDTDKNLALALLQGVREFCEGKT